MKHRRRKASKNSTKKGERQLWAFMSCGGLYYFGPRAFLAPAIVRLICMHRWSKTPNYRRNIDLIIPEMSKPHHHYHHRPTKGYSGGKRAWRNGGRCGWRQKKKMFAGNTRHKTLRRNKWRCAKFMYLIFFASRKTTRDERKASAPWSLPGITHSADISLSLLLRPTFRRPCFAAALSQRKRFILRALFASHRRSVSTKARKEAMKVNFPAGLFRATWPTRQKMPLSPSLSALNAESG